jgi:hypothetical protein
LREPNEDEVISLNMYGSLGWEHNADNIIPEKFLSGSVNVSVGISKKVVS